MKKLAGLLILLLSVAAWAGDRSTEVERVESAATVLDEIMAAPDKGIPERVIDNAKCIAVVPSLLKGGFVVGASYGRGIASCRTEKGWTPPAFFMLAGGSVGFQIGGQAVDVVMLVMNDHGMRSLLNSKFKLGADASVAAGPVGRQAEGSTDLTLRAEVLTYSRARGIFAGVTLNGASVKQDRDATRAFYGRMVPYRTLLTGGHSAPEGVEPWITALNRYAGGSTTDTRPPARASVPPPAEAPANPPARTAPAESDIPADQPPSSDQPH
jgi:lipid-binding SYLF domain-containing protein